MPKKTAPLLSVIVPVYNVARFLDTCLESVQSQDFASDEIEVIMVNDGSFDGSDLIAERWARQYDNFHLINQVNGGLSAARNTGIEHATGKYLVFLDSDDIVAPAAYRNMVNLLEKSGSDFATGGVSRFKSLREEPWNWKRLAGFHDKTRTSLSLNDNPKYIRDAAPWNKIYRRDFFLNSGVVFPEGRIYEDIATTPKLYYRATSFDVYGDKMYYWRFSPDGISLSVNPRKMFDRLLSLEESGKFLREQRASKQILEEYEYFCIDYNLRRILLDAWKYEPEDRQNIIKASGEFIRKLDPKIFNKIPGSLQSVVKLAYDGREERLFQLLSVKQHEDQPLDTSTPFRQKARSFAGRLKRGLLSIKPRLKTFIKDTIVYFILRPIVFVLPLNNREAVFTNYWGERFGTGSGPAAICIKLHELDPTFKCIVFADNHYADTVRNNIKELIGSTNSVSVVINGSLKYYYYLWHSKWLFNDVNFRVGRSIFGRYYFAGKRKGQVEVQTTHGIPLKKMGLHSEGAVKILPLFLEKNKRYDYLVSSSPVVAKLFTEAHGINPAILETGLPQNDVLFSSPSPKAVSALRAKYNINPNKKVIVYVPTWRYNKNAGMRYLIDFHKLYEAFGSSHQIIIKPHTWNHTNLQSISFRDLTSYSEVKSSDQRSDFIKLYGNIRDFLDIKQKIYGESDVNLRKREIIDADINELMTVADVLITDYSSTMFNYFHLHKPQIFFTPDIKFYDGTRGSYFNIDEIAPGKVAKNTDDLIEGIRQSENKENWDKMYRKQIDTFENDYLLWEKGNASEKIINQIGILGDR